MRLHAVAAKIVSSCLAMTVLLFAGCGGGNNQPKSASITGKITFEGQPVTEGRLTFMSAISAGSVEVTSEGTYLITEGVPPGKYKVVLSPPSITTPPMVGEAPPVMKKYDNIPEKYRSETTTPLFADVKDGDNTLDFDLKP